jgi:hypothetical protein
MSRNSRTGEALDRVRQAAAQLEPAAAKLKPLAGSTGAILVVNSWSCGEAELKVCDGTSQNL